MQDIPFVERLWDALEQAGDQIETSASRRKNWTIAWSLSVAAVVAVTIAALAGLRSHPNETGPGSTTSAPRVISLAPVDPTAPSSNLPALTTSTSRLPPGILDADVDPAGLRVWVAGVQSVFELDAETGAVVRRFPFPGSFGEEDEKIEATGDGIWVASLGQLTKIDPGSGITQGPIGVHGRNHAAGLVSDARGLWVSWEDGELDLLAPDTGDVLSSYQVGESGQLFTGDGGVWLVPTSGEDHATLIDPSGEPIVTVLGASESIVAAGGYLWTLDGNVVTGFNLSTGETVAGFSIPRAAILAPDGDRLWVFSVPGSMDSGLYEPDPKRPALVWLIDAKSLSFAGVADVDVSPASLTAHGGIAWVTHYDKGVVTRVASAGA